MPNLPKVIVSSVIRSTHQGQSHGGVYLVDTGKKTAKQVLDWDSPQINWQGRGGDRGLRGIAFYKDRIYLAASNEVFVFDTDFKLIKSFSNQYLQHCHEIFIYQDRLFLTSTGYDSLLEFDLQSERFTKGYLVRYFNLTNRSSLLFRLLYRLRAKPTLKVFDPNSGNGPLIADTVHINSVFYTNNTLYFSGVNMGNLFEIKANSLSTYAPIPFKTHNARPFRDGTLANDTHNNQIVWLDKRGNLIESFKIMGYQPEQLLMSHFPEDHARQRFGRGLCSKEDWIIGGSSPATISIYQLGSGREPIATINISMDIRNAVHGLEIWPY